MAKTVDIQDATLRGKLEEAERLIDADKFREAVELCADTYLLFMRQHPDLVPHLPPGFRGIGPVGAPPGAGPGGPTTVWPLAVGLKIVFDEDGKPETTFEKERFTFSEAASCFEFTLDLVTRAERG